MYIYTYGSRARARFYQIWVDQILWIDPSRAKIRLDRLLPSPNITWIDLDRAGTGYSNGSRTSAKVDQIKVAKRSGQGRQHLEYCRRSVPEAAK